MAHLAREDGQGLIEYALILLFVAVVVLVILGIFGEDLRALYTLIVSCLPVPTPACPAG